MPNFLLDPELQGRVSRIIKKFPDSFGHINHKDVVVQLVTDNQNLKAYAEVKKVPAWMQAAVRYKIVMLFYDELFNDVNEAAQNVIIVHELEHIQPHPMKPHDYALKDHEVQDWGDMVELLGRNWAEEMPDDLDILSVSNLNWQDALPSAVANLTKKKSKKRNRSRTTRPT